MTPKEKAKQLARIIHTNYCKNDLQSLTETGIEKAISEAVEQEREACAKIAEAIRGREDTAESERCDGPFYSTIAEEIRDKIRARPQQD